MLFAIKRKSFKVVNLLLSISKDANHCNKSKVSALSIACGAGSLELVKLLIDEGAEVDSSGIDNLKKAQGDSPGKNILTPLMFAAKNDHAEIVEYLVKEAGAYIEAKDMEQKTALLWSLEGVPDANALKMLLKLGANPYAKDIRGETALHIAAFHNRSKIAEILLEEEPDLIDALNDDFKMPIHLAIYQDFRNEDYVKYSSFDEWKTTKKGNMEVLQVLLKFNPDLDYRDQDGMTLLHYALKERGIADVE